MAARGGLSIEDKEEIPAHLHHQPPSHMTSSPPAPDCILRFSEHITFNLIPTFPTVYPSLRTAAPPRWAHAFVRTQVSTLTENAQARMTEKVKAKRKYSQGHDNTEGRPRHKTSCSVFTPSRRQTRLYSREPFFAKMIQTENVPIIPSKQRSPLLFPLSGFY